MFDEKTLEQLQKVYNSELVMAIPEGSKCFAWFTYFKESPVCLLFELVILVPDSINSVNKNSGKDWLAQYNSMFEGLNLHDPATNAKNEKSPAINRKNL